MPSQISYTIPSEELRKTQNLLIEIRDLRRESIINADIQRMMTIKEVQQFLNFKTRQPIDELINRGILPIYDLGPQTIRIKKSDLLSYLETRKNKRQ